MCNLADNTIVAEYRRDVPFQIFESQHMRLRLAAKCEKASHRAPEIVLQISRECGDSENPQTIDDYAWCDRRKWRKRDKHQSRSLNEFSRKVNECQSNCSVQKFVFCFRSGIRERFRRNSARKIRFFGLGRRSATRQLFRRKYVDRPQANSSAVRVDFRAVTKLARVLGHLL